MSQILVIVESNKKAKTINKYLGNDYKVIASGGHIRDMPATGELGFNEKTLEIQYEMPENNQKWVNTLKKYYAKGAFSHTILAADPDREGEAIAQALFEELGLTTENSSRATFNEITQSAIDKAIKSSDKKGIDHALVNAQETRRILDRYVGWIVSTAVSKHFGQRMPVGRVQSQAVQFVAQRDNEINKFVPTEHFEVSFHGASEQNHWKAKLDLEASDLGIMVDHKQGQKRVWTDKENASKLLDFLNSSKAIAECLSFDETKGKSSPPPPFTTSTMQQAAINNLKIRGKDVDKIAQSLYQDGYITYPRTDSVRLSDEKYENLKKYCQQASIEMSEPRRMFDDKASTQGAHECIVPTDFFANPPLEGDYKRLYELIRNRAILSQLADREFIKRVAVFKVSMDDKDYIFKAVGITTTKSGYTSFFSKDNDIGNVQSEGENLVGDLDSALPTFTKNETVGITSGESIQSLTTPPDHYTQASLNKKLDEMGIGRPSTYSAIFERVLAHNYVVFIDKTNKIKATESGLKLVDGIGDIFQIMNPSFTKQMEEELDDIAHGTNTKEGVLRPFFEHIKQDIATLNNEPKPANVHLCTQDGCTGSLFQFTKADKNKVLRTYWYCSDCSKLYWEREGVPVDPDKIKNEFLTEDGKPKYPCPSCQSALKRFQKKDKSGYFWSCSNRDCNTILNDFEESPDFENKKEKHDFLLKRDQYLRENGESHYCELCNEVYIPVATTAKAKIWKCTGCYAVSFSKPDGSDFRDIGMMYEPFLNPDLTPLVACPDCGGALIKQQNQGLQEVRCSGISAKKLYCKFNKNPTISVEEFDRLFEES